MANVGVHGRRGSAVPCDAVFASPCRVASVHHPKQLNSKASPRMTQVAIASLDCRHRPGCLRVRDEPVISGMMTTPKQTSDTTVKATGLRAVMAENIRSACVGRMNTISERMNAANTRGCRCGIRSFISFSSSERYGSAAAFTPYAAADGCAICFTFPHLIFSVRLHIPLLFVDYRSLFVPTVVL